MSENSEKKILVIKNDGTEVMTIEQAVKEFRVSEKQILLAIQTGHSLKTMYFDEIEK